ncbi:DUF929 domain-containing protein [Sulfurisphaera ohwakuensis]|uniref:DUF929 domain-containing protein n=1 Tax=Sulfurisphaera ohwakuensis TaxID=69656 RepID=A0A650CEW4_SULOH|nr:DUF929 domain-containing protein [Sulfurisphaera ohwakuensis]MBB5254772.1 hypothetical protein [Sulfurisphaera ohwakuensis]QGR16393.1 DUF929 domain-containing protein [Sulfurisphaera ohwakuensis]
MNTNKLIAVIFGIIIIIGIVVLLSLRTQQTMASGGLGYIFKVNNINYAGNNTVQIYFISWYGCPNGAASSWVLYLVLSKYGIVNVKPHTSKFVPRLDSAIPGLIFLNYTPKSNVDFHFIYLYNEYLNETVTGIPISGDQAIYLGLQELKSEVPNWVYKIVYFYNIEDKLVNLSNGSIAFAYKHLVTTCIITGPKGTYAFILFPNPITPEKLLQALNVSSLSMEEAKNVADKLLTQINSGKIPNIILEAVNNLNQIIIEESE